MSLKEKNLDYFYDQYPLGKDLDPKLNTDQKFLMINVKI